MSLKDPISSRINVLGVGISAINMDLALRAIESWIDAADLNYVCVTPRIRLWTLTMILTSAPLSIPAD